MSDEGLGFGKLIDLKIQVEMTTDDRAFYKLDAELRFLAANETALRFWGKTSAEVVGRKLDEVFPETSGTEPFKAHEQALRTLRAYRGKVRSPVLGRSIDLEIHPTSAGLDVSFVQVDTPASGGGAREP